MVAYKSSKTKERDDGSEERREEKKPEKKKSARQSLDTLRTVKVPEYTLPAVMQAARDTEANLIGASRSFSRRADEDESAEEQQQVPEIPESPLPPGTGLIAGPAIGHTVGPAISDAAGGLISGGGAAGTAGSATGGLAAGTPVGSAASGGTLTAGGTILPQTPGPGYAGSVAANPALYANPSVAGPATAAALAAAAYNYGGRNILDGDSDKADYVDVALQSNPLTAWVNPVVDAIGLGSVGEALGLDRKRTKEYQAERWGEVYENIDPESETGKYIEEYANEISDPQNTQPKTFEEMNALDLTPGLAFFQTAGNRWLEELTEPQRIEIARRAQEEGLLFSEKGDILTNNEARLLEIIDEVSLIQEGLPTRYDLYPEEYGEAPVEEPSPQEPQMSGGQPSAQAPSRRPRRPRGPGPDPYVPPEAPILPPEPQQPPDGIRTPGDFTEAYLQIYEDNQRYLNPINRSY